MTTTTAGPGTGVEPTTATPLVRLSGAGKRYGNIIALHGVDLEVGGGEVTCVLGDNGAGKSTLIKIIAGLHQHSEGTYEVEGVPVKRVKIGLFMAVGFTAWFTGMHILFEFNTVQSGIGVGNEFIYIIAAVVGGALLTGGYGSAIGAAVGAFIFGMTTQGIVYAGWDPNWFRAFLGVMLLLAVLVNLYIKNYAAQRR